MRPGACPRALEAEALRDGRLAGAERARFEQHAALCALCAHELRALEALAELVRQGGEARADLDELHVRRERTRLLAAFGGAALAPEPRASAGRAWGWTAAAALVCAALGVWYSRPSGVSEAGAVVRAAQGAVWSKRAAGEREWITLERGELSIRVEHRVSRQPRLLVVLPDGELEDIGTTFTVSAQDGRTTRVAVQEGSVVLRLRGQAPQHIAAGDAWTPAPPSLEPACASPAPQASARAARADGPAQAAAPPRRESPGAQAETVREFRAAMNAFQRGQHRAAAAAFTNFLAKHPRDARAEDAAYLRIIAWQKAGADAEMNWAALRYLEHFPAGLRHADVARLAESRAVAGAQRE